MGKFIAIIAYALMIFGLLVLLALIIKTILKFYSNRKKSKNIVIEPDTVYPKINDGKYYANLKITNNENYPLIDCVARLEKLLISGNGQKSGFVDAEILYSMDDRELSWAGKSKKNVDIRPNKSEKVQIASYEKQKTMKFLLNNGVETAIGLFYIEISVNGNIKGEPIKEKIFIGTLRLESEYHKGGTTQIKTTSIENGEKIVKEEVIQDPDFRTYEFIIEPCERII